ncbi:hypothetical protein E2542_SST25645 [Spatholobus suberectus]|nr:hypothetical protein E2542_SST25645 [Spatholobus suberectus]
MSNGAIVASCIPKETVNSKNYRQQATAKQPAATTAEQLAEDQVVVKNIDGARNALLRPGVTRQAMALGGAAGCLNALKWLRRWNRQLGYELAILSDPTRVYQKSIPQPIQLD